MHKNFFYDWTNPFFVTRTTKTPLFNIQQEKITKTQRFLKYYNEPTMSGHGNITS